MATSRTIAVGDIHGCLAALETLLAAIRPQPEDTIVTLGDYIDRGPDCRGTVQRLIDLGRQCRLIPLLGNHDDMMLKVHDGRDDLYVDWLLFGGNATLVSYDTNRPEEILPRTSSFSAAAGCSTSRSVTSIFTATIWPTCRLRTSRRKCFCGTR